MDYIVFSADNSISHQNRNLSNPFTPSWTGEPAFLPLRLTQAGSDAGIFRKIDPIPDEEHVHRPDLAAVVPLARKMFVEEAEQLRVAGGEYGAATGRPRRVGGFDVVASHYGVKMQGCTSIALTKLDVLSYLDKIPVCVAYDIDGERVDRFPIGVKLAKAKPIYEYLPGFHCDISGCRTISDLPKEALDYVHYLEAAVGCRIKYVSVGPDRDAYIKMF